MLDAMEFAQCTPSLSQALRIKKLSADGKLTVRDIRYVMNCMQENTTKIRSIKQYMLAALYNAPATIDSYYRAEVNHDMAEGKI